MAIARESTVDPMRRTKRVDPAILEHFGRELATWVRDNCEDNQSAAARALGVTQGHISAMINGTRGPGLQTLVVLADKTGRSIDSLLGREREKSREDRILAEFAELKAELRSQRSEPPPTKGTASDAPRPRRR
jgi:transcriptional regulator with XRE-family HTH domain